MSSILVAYWSGTGNTQLMAQAVADGAKAAGAEVTLKEVGETTPDAALSYDRIALGCPSMGAEELEDGEMEPFFSELEGKLAGKKTVLFGSYDWGDGEWMRIWQERAQAAGADMAADGLICNLTPGPNELAQCEALGRTLAGV